MDPIILTQTGGYFLVDVLVGQTWPRCSEPQGRLRTWHFNSHALSTDDPRSISFGTLTGAPPDPKRQHRLSPGNVCLKRRLYHRLQEVPTSAEMLALSRALPGYYQHSYRQKTGFGNFQLTFTSSDVRQTVASHFSTPSALPTQLWEFASVPNARYSVPSPRT